MKKERCEFLHIHYEKRRLFLRALLMVGIGLSVFLLGLLLNKWENRNIFTVLSILFVLPMARYLTTLVILLPYRSPEEKLYQMARAALPEGSILYSDYVFTLSEKVMGLSFLAITKHELIGLSLRPKEKTDQMTKILTEALKKRSFPGKVTILTSPEEWQKRLSMAEPGEKESINTELLDFLKSLAV